MNRATYWLCGGTLAYLGLHVLAWAGVPAWAIQGLVVLPIAGAVGFRLRRQSQGIVVPPTVTTVAPARVASYERIRVLPNAYDQDADGGEVIGEATT